MTRAEAIDQLRQDYEEAGSFSKLGEKKGVTPMALCKACKRLGIPAKPRGGANNPNGKTPKQYEFMGETGSLRELAERRGLKYITVWARINKQGKTLAQALETPVHQMRFLQ